LVRSVPAFSPWYARWRPPAAMTSNDMLSEPLLHPARLIYSRAYTVFRNGLLIRLHSIEIIGYAHPNLHQTAPISCPRTKLTAISLTSAPRTCPAQQFHSSKHNSTPNPTSANPSLHQHVIIN